MRTLLLNVAGSPGQDFTYPGEEYVPPGFVAVALPPSLATVSKLIFGGTPDRAMLNYRLQEILTILHGTELADHVLALDPRVTYLPPNPNLLAAVTAGLVVKQFAGTAPRLQVLNSGLVDQSGHIYFSWRLDVVDGATLNVTYYDPARQFTVTQGLPYTLTGGMSQPLTLPASSLTFTFSGNPGSSWAVSGVARPGRCLSDVVAGLDKSLGESRYDTLFGIDPPEPYKTFRNLWERHDNTCYRLGGMVLALGYRTDEVRRMTP